MAQLAIKGHETRGREVIELLEMLGGVNINRYSGNDKDMIYFINSDYYGSIDCDIELNIHLYKSYSLEGFLEKFPYKIGDKVFAFGIKWTIINAVWDGSIEEVVYTIKSDTTGYTTTKLSNRLQPYFYKEETMKEKLEQIILEIPAGYEFFGINDDNKVVLTKKQLKYPQTYKECLVTTTYDKEERILYLLEKLKQLIICRNAYWEIAGKEMGLDKPWEPQFQNYNIQHYCIFVNIKGNIHKCCFYASKCLLAFPTEEMRDDFYENFKDLIEECKELL